MAEDPIEQLEALDLALRALRPSDPAAVALLREWRATCLDGHDEEFAPWLDSFTARVDAVLSGEPSEALPEEPTEVKHLGQFHGKDCPRGMVQIEFVGCPPSERYSNYGWKPTKSALLEVYVDGQRFRIDVGSFQDGSGNKRRGLHIYGPIDMVVDKHSINAVDVYFTAAPQGE